MDKCRYCGQKIYWKSGGRSDRVFHNDDCKDAFHAERRRLERAKKRILAAFGDIEAGKSSPSEEIREMATLMQDALMQELSNLQTLSE